MKNVITCRGRNWDTKKKGIAARRQMRSEMPSTLRTATVSPLPQNWALNMHAPLLTPNSKRMKTKLSLLAMPTAEMAVSPSPPIITLSIINRPLKIRF